MKKFTVLSLVIILCVFCLTVSAHDLWINMEDYTPEADSEVKLTLGYGHGFAPIVGEFLTHDNLDKIYIIDPDGRKSGINPTSDIEYEVESAIKKMGTYLVVAEKKAGFSTSTTEGRKSQSKRGLKNVISCRSSEKCAKAIVTMGKGSANFSKVVGHTLEIVPQKNPCDLRQGDYLPVKVIFQNKPLAYTHVYATYAGFSNEYIYVYAYTTMTNKEGVARIKLLKDGVWLIKVAHTVPYSDPEECDEVSCRSTLTFEVK